MSNILNIIKYAEKQTNKLLHWQVVTIRNCLQTTIQRRGRLILKMTFEIQGRTWAQTEWTTVTTSALFAPYSSSLRIMELISLQQRMDTTQLVHTCMHSEYWWPLMSSDQLLTKNIYSSLHFHRDTQLMFYQIFNIMFWSRVWCWFTLFIQLYCKLRLEMRLVLLFNIFFFTSIHCKSFGCLFSMSSWKV